MDDHRWSGWPGAWCLDCGIADPLEECLANCDHDLFSDDPCPIHVRTACEHPGERLFDPYSTRSADADTDVGTF